MASLRQLIDNRVDAAIPPENQSIKSDIMRKIEDDKLRLKELEQQYENYDKDDLAEGERAFYCVCTRACRKYGATLYQTTKASSLAV